MAIYVMSDIHGQKALFDKMLKKIKFTKNDELYILGDVVDRGPDGVKMLLEIINTPNIHMLLGNHEHMMKHCISSKCTSARDETLSMWVMNGGRTTIEQFKTISQEEREIIKIFLDSLPVEIDITVNNNEFILCHAQPHPSSFKRDPFDDVYIRCYYDTDEEFSVWHRYQLLSPGSNEAPHGVVPDENFSDKTIIFGHTPVCYFTNIESSTNEIYKEGNTINIDCGCATIPFDNNARDGKLACLRLDDMKEFYECP